MKQITEYIEIKEGEGSAKLSFPVLYITEIERYSLHQDTFKLYNTDDNSYIVVAGEIEKRDSDFYLIFDSSTTQNGFLKIAVTYTIEDNTLSTLEKLSQLLQLDLEKVDDFEILKEAFYSTNFIETEVGELTYLPTLITQKVDYLASQYRNSIRLKNLLLSSLIALQESFLETSKVPYILDLENATAYKLDLIGKIIGINRHYCGNFSKNLNYAMDTVMSRNHLSDTIEEITLDDEHFRKLIEIKIIKNAKKIVNYKELSEIISYFVGDYTQIHTSGNYEIGIYIPYAKNELRDYFVLLRACLPLPPTIRLNYWEIMESISEPKELFGVRTFQNLEIEVEELKLEEQFDLLDRIPISSHTYQSLQIDTAIISLEEEFSIVDRADIAEHSIQCSDIETKELELLEEFEIKDRTPVATHAYQSLQIDTAIISLEEEFSIVDRADIAEHSIQCSDIETTELTLKEDYTLEDKNQTVSTGQQIDNIEVKEE